MTTSMFKKSLIAATIALATSQVNAAAFQLNEHSASGLGRAFAGEAAIADNAAVLARNPAAMTTFDKMAVSVAGTYIKPDVDVEGRIATQLGNVPASESSIAPSAFVPAAYFIQPLNDQWAWGIGLFSNYGLSTEYSKTFPAGSGAGDTELMTLNINPNLAYRINDNFSVGAGINAVYGSAELNRYAGLLGPAIGQNADTRLAHLKGDTWGFGWNVGTLYEVNENHRFALTYRSQVDMSFDGDFQGATSLNRTVDGNLKLDLPAQAEFAGYHRLNPQFAVHYSVNWNDWSAFEELKATSSQCGAGVCLQKPEKFKDSLRYAIGGTWYINPSWEARLGFAYDNTPIEAEYRSLSIPDSDRMWYSTGATYHINPDMSLDFGLTYIDGEEVDVNEGLRGHEPALNNPRWRGTSHGNAFLAAAGFNMQFLITDCVYQSQTISNKQPSKRCLLGCLLGRRNNKSDIYQEDNVTSSALQRVNASVIVLLLRFQPCLTGKCLLLRALNLMEHRVNVNHAALLLK